MCTGYYFIGMIPETVPMVEDWIRDDLELLTIDQCADLLIKYCTPEVLKK